QIVGERPVSLPDVFPLLPVHHRLHDRFPHVQPACATGMSRHSQMADYTTHRRGPHPTETPSVPHDDSCHPQSTGAPLSRWSGVVVRHPWACLLVPLVTVLLLLPAAMRATDYLTPAGWVPD